MYENDQMDSILIEYVEKYFLLNSCKNSTKY